MSKLLDDLRSEQEHYERSVHGDGRAERIKLIADHIESIEKENKELKAENKKLKNTLRNIDYIARPEYEKFLISKWGLIISEIARLEIVGNIKINKEEE